MKRAELRWSPEAWFVMAVWLGASVIALRFIHVFGWNFPYWDDFAHVPYLTHERPITLEWLWENHNEHRIPFGKLVLIATSTLSRGNYRVPMYLSALLLAAGSGSFVWALAKKRGAVLYSDAAVPLVVLNLAQWENLTWGHQVPFVMSAMLPLTFATVSILWPRNINVQGALAAACWGWGMSVAMFLGAAGALFGWRAATYRDESTPFRRLSAVWCIVLFALFASYVFSLPPAIDYHGPRTAALMLAYAARLIGDALVASGQAWPVPSIAVATVCVLTALALRTDRSFRANDAILTVVAFVVVTGASITWGRVPLGVEQAFASRYVTLLAPLLCACYALVAGASVRAPLKQLTASFLLIVCAGGYAAGARDGVELERSRRPGRRATLLAALTMEPGEVALRYGQNLYPDRNYLATELAGLRHERIAAFAQPELVGKLRRTTPEPQNLGISPVPTTVEADVIEDDTTLGARGLLLHAPSKMMFQLASGSYTLSGRYGFRPAAYLDGVTDGAEFSVWLDDGQRRLLWQRVVRPVEHEADRGSQRLLVTFELTRPGKLTLETNTGTANDPDRDWTVWAGVQITPNQVEPASR